MTGRTLEEIEALAAEATPGPWKAVRSELRVGRLRICSNVNAGDSSLNIGQSIERAHANTELMAELHNLLAIAQGQREALNRIKLALLRCEEEGIDGCFQDAIRYALDPDFLAKQIGTKK